MDQRVCSSWGILRVLEVFVKIRLRLMELVVSIRVTELPSYGFMRLRVWRYFHFHEKRTEIYNH